MQMAKCHAETQPKTEEFMGKASHARSWKQATFLCEVVGLKGDKSMDCGTQNKKKSMLSWKARLPQVQKPSKGCFNKWNKFISQLRTTEVVTKIDFMKYSASKWQISEDKRTLKITEENGNEICHMRQDENTRNMECRNTTQPVLDT